MERQCRTTNKGFTLMEVLLAIFIGSIVLTALYASFFQIIKAKERIEEELDLYHEARVVMAKVTKDLAMAYPRGLVNSESTNITLPYFYGVQDGNFSRLIFTALSRSPAYGTRESDQTEISYYLLPVPDSDLFALMRRDNPTIENEEGGTQFPLSERVVGFRLTYFAGPNELGEIPEPTLEWNSNEMLSLPRAVNVEVVMRDPRGENVEFSSMITLPIVD
ncbi:MAG TPA: prepilin-type N-terminal cleavage/methylation domain-containing protein [Thermodesulfobacteriota bacterium]|nr:prepilin-type N-terminal cleavage/methylation domain-containing protein [Thermodesulfobacteriota bacterium]